MVTTDRGSEAIKVLTRKDFVSDEEVRWCPGCGDYSILAQTQRVMPDLGVPRENIVFISGIGCSSRLPYYMNTYGFHSLHVLRRNVDLQIVLHNNEVYGLTKGQYSPTSPVGTVKVSTPMGSIDYPLKPLAVALGAEATFVARSLDAEPHHMVEMLKAAHDHRGASFVEIYQNCNIYNDEAFEEFTAKDVRADRMLYLKQGEPMIFGKNRDKGIRINGLRPEVVEIGKDGITEADILVHDATLEDP